MFSDFINAAFPWILIGLFVAISCSLMSKKERQLSVWHVGKSEFAGQAIQSWRKEYDLDSCVTDYSFGKEVIYAAFSWSAAAEACLFDCKNSIW